MSRPLGSDNRKGRKPSLYKGKRQVKTKHGTRTMYQYHKCRCELCRGANRDHVLRWKESIVGKIPAYHNRSTYINWSCRCYICTAQNSEYCKNYLKGVRHE